MPNSHFGHVPARAAWVATAGSRPRAHWHLARRLARRQLHLAIADRRLGWRHGCTAGFHEAASRTWTEIAARGGRPMHPQRASAVPALAECTSNRRPGSARHLQLARLLSARACARGPRPICGDMSRRAGSNARPLPEQVGLFKRRPGRPDNLPAKTPSFRLKQYQSDTNLFRNTLPGREAGLPLPNPPTWERKSVQRWYLIGPCLSYDGIPVVSTIGPTLDADVIAIKPQPHLPLKGMPAKVAHPGLPDISALL